jgi:NADH-quinone oxidoreductase subunit C/D
VLELQNEFGAANIVPQATQDGIATVWTPRETIRQVLHHLKTNVPQPYKMLYDLTAIDERMRVHRVGQAPSDFTVVYHLLSFDRNEYARIKVPLQSDDLHMASISNLWPAANWYEREVWDMFGIAFEGHPHLERLLMPKTWQGHPLRKDHPARATEMGPFELPDEKEDKEQEALRFRPEEWGMKRHNEET